MPNPRVTINVVTSNSLPAVTECLASWRNQLFEGLRLAVIDNYSHDGSVEYIRSFSPSITVLQNVNPYLGPAKAYNQGVKLCKTEYLLTLACDIFMERDVVLKLVAAMDADPKLGSCGGKLLSHIASGIHAKLEPDIILSAGLLVRHDGKIIHRGFGEEDKGQHDTKSPLFGVCGDFALYRVSALMDVALERTRGAVCSREYFDEEYETGFEDVDLAWRLQLRGWRSMCVPDAIGYKILGGCYQVFGVPFDGTVSPLIFRNHLLTLVKNMQMKDMASCGLALTWNILKTICFFLVLHPIALLRETKKFFWRFPGAYQSRVYIQKRTTSFGVYAAWFKGQKDMLL